MNYRLKDVVEVGDSISYAYDFGPTTELILNIHSCRDGEKKDNEIVILSRNISCQYVIHLEWAYVGMMEVMYILINLSQMKNRICLKNRYSQIKQLMIEILEQEGLI